MDILRFIVSDITATGLFGEIKVTDSLLKRKKSSVNRWAFFIVISYDRSIDGR